MFIVASIFSQRPGLFKRDANSWECAKGRDARASFTVEYRRRTLPGGTRGSSNWISFLLFANKSGPFPLFPRRSYSRERSRKRSRKISPGKISGKNLGEDWGEDWGKISEKISARSRKNSFILSFAHSLVCSFLRISNISEITSIRDIRSSKFKK